MAPGKKLITEEKAKLKMADLCARSEQCEYDILQKLIKMRLPSAIRENIIRFLKDERFIDEERYARCFAKDKCRFSAWGPFKIRQALALKRIKGTTIAEALEAIDDKDWKEAIDKAATTKIRLTKDFDAKDYESKMRLYKYLLSRGFTSKQISSALQRLQELKKNE